VLVFERGYVSGDQTQMNEAVELACRAVDEAGLGTALHLPYRRSGDADDLAKVIDATREAVTPLPADDPGRPGLLADLAEAIRQRYEQHGEVIDLDEAVGLARAALALAPPEHGVHPAVLHTLALALKAAMSAPPPGPTCRSR